LTNIGDIIQNNFGGLVLFVLLFCIFITVCVPVLETILLKIKTYNADCCRYLGNGYVFVSVFRKHMLQNNNEFMLALYPIHQREANAVIQSNTRIRRIILANFLLLVANLFVSVFTDGRNLLMDMVLELLKSKTLNVQVFLVSWSLE
jgi:hypothetical protein